MKEKSIMSLKDIGLDFYNTRSDEAFRKLYNRLAPGLLRYINNIVKDSEKSKDLLSEVMAKAYSSIHMYDPKYHISTWIYRIAYTYACGDLRVKKRKKTTTVGSIESMFDQNIMSKLEFSQAQENFNEIYNNEDSTAKEDQVKVIINELDSDLKEVISLRFYENLKPKQISEFLEIPAIEVQKKINKAKRILKTKLNKNAQFSI